MLKNELELDTVGIQLQNMVCIQMVKASLVDKWVDIASEYQNTIVQYSDHLYGQLNKRL